MDLNLLHVLNLDSLGGVERYFTAFLAHRSPEVRPRHGALVLSREIHPYLERDVRARATVHAWKRAGGVKLPSWPAAVRASYRARVARRYHPGIALFWNTLGELEGLRAAKRARLFTVYWERGLAWHRARGEEGAAEFLAGVDAVIANSRAGRRILQETRGYAGPIEVCRNALRPDAVPADPRPRSLAPDRPLRLGVAARLVSYKGVSVALHALAELSRRGVDAVLEVAGTGPLENDLKDVAARLGLGERARFLGTVDDVGAFYDGLDVLVHPALCEPCANVLPEAMARGVPVVAALVDGNPELVLDGATGILVPPTLPLAEYPRLGGHASPMPPFVYDPLTDAAIEPRLLDPARVADAVVELTRSRERYTAASERAIDHVRVAFDATAQLDGVLDALAALAAGAGEAAGR